MIRCTEVESSAEWNTNSFPLDTGAGSHHFIQLDLIELETSHRFLEETLGNWGKKSQTKNKNVSNLQKMELENGTRAIQTHWRRLSHVAMFRRVS